MKIFRELGAPCQPVLRLEQRGLSLAVINFINLQPHNLGEGGSERHFSGCPPYVGRYDTGVSSPLLPQGLNEWFHPLLVEKVFTDFRPAALNFAGVATQPNAALTRTEAPPQTYAL